MRILNLLIISLFFMVSDVLAQSKNFGLDQAGFFKGDLTLAAIRNLEQMNSEEIPAEELWIEPVIQQNGSTAQYIPPPEVKSFLDNPTEETGNNYLKWTMKRIEKLSKAEDILKKITSNLNPLSAQNNQALAAHNGNIKYMAFFLLKNCPYCKQQEDIIEKILKNRPDIRVDVFVKGYTNEEIKEFPFKAKPEGELSKSLGFNKFPTTLIIDGQGNRSLVGGVLDDSLTHEILAKSDG